MNFQSAEQGDKMCVLEIQLSLMHTIPSLLQVGSMPALLTTTSGSYKGRCGQELGAKKVAKGPMMEMPCTVAGDKSRLGRKEGP